MKVQSIKISADQASAFIQQKANMCNAQKREHSNTKDAATTQNLAKRATLKTLVPNNYNNPKQTGIAGQGKNVRNQTADRKKNSQKLIQSLFNVAIHNPKTTQIVQNGDGTSNGNCDPLGSKKESEANLLSGEMTANKQNLKQSNSLLNSIYNTNLRESLLSKNSIDQKENNNTNCVIINTNANGITAKCQGNCNGSNDGSAGCTKIECKNKKFNNETNKSQNISNQQIFINAQKNNFQRQMSKPNKEALLLKQQKQLFHQSSQANALITNNNFCKQQSHQGVQNKQKQIKCSNANKSISSQNLQQQQQRYQFVEQQITANSKNGKNFYNSEIICNTEEVSQLNNSKLQIDQIQLNNSIQYKNDTTQAQMNNSNFQFNVTNITSDKANLSLINTSINSYTQLKTLNNSNQQSTLKKEDLDQNGTINQESFNKISQQQLNNQQVKQQQQQEYPFQIYFQQKAENQMNIIKNMQKKSNSKAVERPCLEQQTLQANNQRDFSCSKRQISTPKQLNNKLTYQQIQKQQFYLKIIKNMSPKDKNLQQQQPLLYDYLKNPSQPDIKQVKVSQRITTQPSIVKNKVQGETILSQTQKNYFKSKNNNIHGIEDSDSNNNNNKQQKNATELAFYKKYNNNNKPVDIFSKSKEEVTAEQPSKTLQSVLNESQCIIRKQIEETSQIISNKLQRYKRSLEFSSSITRSPSKDLQNSPRQQTYVTIVGQQQQEVMQDAKLTDFFIGKVIGYGSYAQVREADHIKTQKVYALKIYSKEKLKDHTKKQNVQREIEVLLSLNHPNIVSYKGKFETRQSLYLILENVGSLSLNNYMKTKQNQQMEECEARDIFRSIAQAIFHCHQNNVIHRDIKMENVMILPNRQIKLIDFGFSTIIFKNHQLNHFCGTPKYMAPEIIQKKQYQGPPVDIWAYGIMLFRCIAGHFPFNGSSEQELFKKILVGQFDLPNHISPDLQQLIKQILMKNPIERLAANNILSQGWFYPK